MRWAGCRYDRGGDVQVQEERGQLTRVGRRDPLLRKGTGGGGCPWGGRRPDVQSAVAGATNDPCKRGGEAKNKNEVS